MRSTNSETSSHSNNSVASMVEKAEYKDFVKHATSSDIFLLGITIVIGGQYFSWNYALNAGFWEAFLGLTLTGIGYICLVSCIAEMTSALPFSGGSYGFVRACLGPLWGFIVGCLESMQNIAYVTIAVIPFAQMMCIATKSAASSEPGYWAFFYITAIAINVIGGNVFWRTTRILAVVSLLISILYILGTCQYVDFQQFAEAKVNNYDFNGVDFVKAFPFATWFFIGVESLPLTCVDCKEPKNDIPKGLISCVLVLIVTAIGTFFVCAAQSPGTSALGLEALPLNYGFSRLFGISYEQATWLSIPAAYATGFGFIFCYGRQMSSMASSGLFPKLFRLRTSTNSSPYVALTFGSVLTIVGCIGLYYGGLEYGFDVYFICTLSSNAVYISVFISYILFRAKYSSLQRTFRNPFGLAAPIVGICVFLLSILGITVFEDYDHTVAWICTVIFLIAYYHFYGYKYQTFSDDEQKVMFKAYVINANVASKLKKKGGHKGLGSLSKSNPTSSQYSSSISRSEVSSSGYFATVRSMFTSHRIVPSASSVYSPENSSVAALASGAVGSEYDSPQRTHSGTTPLAGGNYVPTEPHTMSGRIVSPDANIYTVEEDPVNEQLLAHSPSMKYPYGKNIDSSSPMNKPNLFGLSGPDVDEVQSQTPTRSMTQTDEVTDAIAATMTSTSPSGTESLEITRTSLSIHSHSSMSSSNIDHRSAVVMPSEGKESELV